MCGFHVAFIATHLPAYLGDHGLPEMAAAAALALIGLFNMGGSYLFGRLGDRYRKKYLLSFLYLARALVISGFLVVPVTTATALVFACAIGFLWLATVPLTSGTVAQIFGPARLSSLYGIVFFSHQVGAFLGVWLGGRIYDANRVLRRGLGGCHRARSRGRGSPPADPGPRPRQPSGCPRTGLTAVIGSAYHLGNRRRTAGSQPVGGWRR